ncbi:MAG TPA: FHA domain-containing protein [Candidatus Binatia bacterium]
MSTKEDSDYTIHGSLRVPQPHHTPDVIDVLIAGAGPAGSAGAFRATELGLSCLLLEYDEALSRIRDYPKEKHIYPEYGDDESPFPAGDSLMASLQFTEIDKDDLVEDWHAKYKTANAPLRIGSELTGLVRGGDGVFEIKTWNHRTQEEVLYHARSVILAIGAGKPRRFQIPGNIDGIAFRLDDAKAYVGGPALVIGGGTSAAEAVIAISNAKTGAKDATAVYWSYRKAQMPRVERSLSGAFFDAYVVNANVRYLPYSEPILVLTAPDRSEVLSVRIDRKPVDGRPTESLHLEFPKNKVVACIGGDVPHQTLQKFGIKIPTIDGEPYIVVTPDGESSLPGVFLVGDLKGTPEYYQCGDFADTGTYKKRRDKRNIKMAMRDAVRAVEVIASRLGKIEGKPAAPAAAPAPSSTDATIVIAPQMASHQAAPQLGDRLVSLLPDGSVESEFPVRGDAVKIGRRTDGLTFDDAALADHHASVTRQDGRFCVTDTGAGSGVWLRVRGEGRDLAAEDQVWLGSQILRLMRHDSGWVLEHYNGRGEYQRTIELTDRGIIVGRAAEVTLDANDRSLSRGHARLALAGGQVRITDIGSTNGCYVRLTAPAVLRSGDEFRIGGHRLRFESAAVEEPIAPGAVVVDLPAQPPPSVAAAPAAATSAAPQPAAALSGPSVSFEDAKNPVAYPVADNRDVLHAFFDYLKARHPDIDLKRCGVDKSRKCPDDHYKEPLDWSCELGTCGYCAVQVVDGANLAPSGNPDLEKNTLQNVRRVSPDLAKYRLACLTRCTGPVTLKVLPKS